MGWIGSAGSSKMAPGTFIFSIVLDAEYLFYFIANYALKFFEHIILVLASVVMDHCVI